MSSNEKAKPAASLGYKSDDEDDNWDDWGDAEDNLPSDPVGKEQNYNEVVRSSKLGENDFNSNKQTEATATTPVQGGTWGSSMWNKWDVMSVLSTATESLGNITSTVSHGLNQVIGVPDPEELARMNAEPHKMDPEKERTSIESTTVSPIGALERRECAENGATAPVFGLNLVSGVTTLGSKVLNTGLDTLEGIGKRTMTMLQEKDPMLRNRRKLLGLEPEKPNLSEVLKEAKKDADQWENTLKEMKLEKSKEMLRFDLLFEQYSGLVHLEALEILSKESTLKLQSLFDVVAGIKALAELEETIKEVEELMELEDLDGEFEGDYTGNELNEKLLAAIEDADLQIHFDDIVRNWSESLEWLTTEAEAQNEDKLFAKAITSLAECCALEMSKLHKIAEQLLVKEHHSTANEVDSIVQLCKQFNIHLNGVTHRFAAALTAKNTDAGKDHAATLYADLQVGVQQNEKAFKLFLPILQIGAF